MKSLKYFLTLTSLMWISIVFLHNRLQSTPVNEDSDKAGLLISDIKDDDLSRDAFWQPVNGTKDKFYVYSAYLDNRDGKKPLVRIIAAALTRNRESVLCKFHGLNGQTYETEAQFKAIAENWNLKYSAAFLTCDLKGATG